MDAMSSAMKMEEYLVNRATERKFPLGGSLELLPLCNMDCDMCYVRLSREEMEKKGRLRTVEEWKKLADEMKAQGVLFLLLTGGEPLLYPDFKELYLYLQELGMILTINSNGTLIDGKWAEFFGRHKPRRINITLYGKNAETYKNLCHYENGFEKTLQAVSLLREQNVDVKLNGSLTKENRGDVGELLAIAERLKVPMHMDTYMYPPEKCVGESVPDTWRMDAEEAAEAQMEIDRYFYGEHYPEYCEKMALLGKTQGVGDCGMKCRAGKSSFAVNWQGQMQPCVMMSWIQYNVFEQGFAKCWKKLTEAVDGVRISEKCASCAWREVCQTCAAGARLETGNYDGVPEYLCRYTEAIMKQITEENQKTEN